LSVIGNSYTVVYIVSKLFFMYLSIGIAWPK